VGMRGWRFLTVKFAGICRGGFMLSMLLVLEISFKPALLASNYDRLELQRRSTHPALRAPLSWKGALLAELGRMGSPSVTHTQAGETPRPHFPLRGGDFR
jgi:hypothetical protein